MVIDDELRTLLFAEADDEGWVGGVFELGLRDVIPVRVDGQDFYVWFLSPYAEHGNDLVFLQQTLDSACVEGFVPMKESRLIKFCRADADTEHFEPEAWPLTRPGKIFLFSLALREAVLIYLESKPAIQQFFYQPAGKKLAKLYGRLFKQMAPQLDGKIAAILEVQGACYAYQRT